MARPIDGTWDSFLLNLSYLTLKDFQENKAGLNTLKTAVEFQPTITSSNEPLTPEQLRDMDGKPIWIEHDEDPQYNHVWMIWNNEIGFRHDLAGYNIFWRAYRYPPEEDT